MLSKGQRLKLKQSILRTLNAERTSIVRRATMEENAVVFRAYNVDPKLLNQLFAEFDNFFNFLEGQDF